jgi:hypothetical protein
MDLWALVVSDLSRLRFNLGVLGLNWVQSYSHFVLFVKHPNNI